MIMSMMSMVSIPLVAACFPILLGFVFMVKCREETVEVFRSPVPAKGKDVVFHHGVATHFMYILGAVMMCLGCFAVATVNAIPVDLSLLIPFSVLFTVLMFMAFTRVSIIGAPHFNFPPVAGVTLVPIVTSLLVYNAYTKRAELGPIAMSPLFIGLLTGPNVLVHMLGFYHRSLGFSAAQVAKDLGGKAPAAKSK